MKMKKIFFLFVIANAVFTPIFAQLPDGINYQAIARDTAGNILANQNMAVKFTILNATGTSVFSEQHTGVKTDRFGLLNLVIGGASTPSDLPDFSINPPHSLVVEIDTNGPASFTMGAVPFQSVPYALYSLKSGNSRSLGAANGLIMSDDTIRMGGALNQNTNITTGSNGLYLVGNPSTDNAIFRSTAATGTGYAIHGKSIVSNGTGIFAESIGSGTAFKSTSSTSGYSGIFTGGNVGIGTLAPNATLDVNGTIATGAFKMTTNSGTDKIMVSDNNGVGTWKPSNINTGFSVSTNTVQVCPSGSSTVVNFGNTFTSSASSYNHGGHFSTNQYIAPSSGVYHFNVSLLISGGVIDTDFTIHLHKNGASEQLRLYRYLMTTGTYSYNLDADLYLTAGDKISVVMNPLGAMNVHPNSSFNGHKVY